MARLTPTFIIWTLCALFILAGPAAAHEHEPGHSSESQESLQAEQSLQFEEAVFEANGSPLYVLNARARVKNLGAKGYRGATVRFFCRLDSSQEWTLIAERLLPGVPPGDSVVCDLVTSSEGLPMVDSQGEVSPCQYRIEVHYQDGVSVREGEFHPACLHEH